MVCVGLGWVGFYLHHSVDPEAAVDGIDADDGIIWLHYNSIEKPKVVCHHN